MAYGAKALSMQSLSAGKTVESVRVINSNVPVR